MIPDNYKQLILKLAEKTAKKQVIWNKTTRDNEYKLSLEKGALTVDRWVDQETDLDSVDLAIYNDRGDQIDRIYVNERQEDFDLFTDFHANVRRSYYKLDETIKSIFNEISSDKVIGKEKPPPDDLPF
jgi:hypothetical protein